MRSRLLHEQECRGCGVTFRTHTRTRAYCQDSCKLLFRHAKAFRKCFGCGVEDSDRLVIVWLRTPQYEQEKQLGVEFATAHKACRAKRLEPRGAELECQCKPCLTDRGEPVLEPRQRSGQRRATNYEKHRAAVYARDELVCQICFIPTDPAAGLYEDKRPVIDHIDRVADGGGDDIGNLRTAHRWCNIALEGPGTWGLEEVVRARAIERFATPV